MRRLVVIVCGLLLAGSVSAQDIHFSQYYNSPLTLNPALTGDFDGFFRFAGNERRQWGSVSVPYQTFSLSADARDLFRKRNFNAGIMLFNDVAGDSRLGKTEVNFLLAFRKTLNSDSTQILTIGGQTGISQRKIDYTNLSFDDEYNGYQYVPNSGVPENFANSGKVHANIALGATWKYLMDDRKNVQIGMALYNINKPNQSFFGNEEIKLDRRLAMFTQIQYKLKDEIDLLPRALFMRQGQFTEFDIGASGRYILEDVNSSYKALLAGLDYRVGSNYQKSITSDAFYLTGGLEYNNWTFGLSYDFNISRLRPASNGLGGFEVSVIYIIKNILPKRVGYKLCPDYI